MTSVLLEERIGRAEQAWSDAATAKEPEIAAKAPALLERAELLVARATRRHAVYGPAHTTLIRLRQALTEIDTALTALIQPADGDEPRCSRRSPVTGSPETMRRSPTSWSCGSSSPAPTA